MTRLINIRHICTLLLALVLTGGICSAGCCSTVPRPSRPKTEDANSVDSILLRLKQKTSGLKSYRCNIEYLFSQPLLESQTLKKGEMYYSRFGDKSKLRINFETLKQDVEPQRQYKEYYIFDGQWLTQIDYQIKHIRRRQLAGPNEPVDAFELAKKNFPILGFSDTEELKKEFEISLAEDNKPDSGRLIKLHLKVKPESSYTDDYTSIDFWVDKTIDLPAKIQAVSTEEDIYEIKLLDAKVNQPIDPNVFEFEIPPGFGEPEIIPLKRN